MTIIEKLVCWYKARFSQLSDKEFTALRDAYKLASTPFIERILATYFRHHIPKNSEVNIICEGNYSFQQLYVLNTPRGRKLSEYEQHCWVYFMPLGGPYRFPSALDEPALTELLDSGAPCKIAAYVRDFALPEKFELRLLELCKKEEKKRFPLNTYHSAVFNYLTFCRESRMTSPTSQRALLAINDEKLTEALMKLSSLDNCLLAGEVIADLIADRNKAALSLLLFKSYVADKDLVQKMLEAFPQLKWQYEISKLRRPMRKLEKDTGEFFGIEAPTALEQKLILGYLGIRKDDDERRGIFIRIRVLPRLKSTAGSPYFCAWAAYNFPETSEKAYQSVRSAAEYLRSRFKKDC